MSFRMSTKYFTARMDRNVAAGIRALEGELPRLYEGVAQQTADEWGDAIRSSGRGGRWNPQMANIQSQVTSPSSGGLFVRVGWLGAAPRAEDGRRTWFAYQDSGYHMFGGPRWIQGLMLQNDARLRLQERLRSANASIARRVEHEVGRP